MSGDPEEITDPDFEVKSAFKFYLGDGAYVDMGSYPGEMVLTTEDGISAQNRVVLGFVELLLLGRWLHTHMPGVLTEMSRGPRK